MIRPVTWALMRFHTDIIPEFIWEFPPWKPHCSASGVCQITEGLWSVSRVCDTCRWRRKWSERIKPSVSCHAAHGGLLKEDRLIVRRWVRVWRHKACPKHVPRYTKNNPDTVMEKTHYITVEFMLISGKITMFDTFPVHFGAVKHIFYHKEKIIFIAVMLNLIFTWTSNDILFKWWHLVHSKVYHF